MNVAIMCVIISTVFYTLAFQLAISG
uniref:Uncharacterized protein n=1 Tax=Anguilla anguilla TaxID=7936 RepID=A0A0E9XC22_ANGAN